MGELIFAVYIYVYGVLFGIVIGLLLRKPATVPLRWEDHEERLRRLEDLARAPAEATLARQITEVWRRERRP